MSSTRRSTARGSAARLNLDHYEKPELEFVDLPKAFELRPLRLDELRKMLIKEGWELTESEVEMKDFASVSRLDPTKRELKGSLIPQVSLES